MISMALRLSDQLLDRVAPKITVSAGCTHTCSCVMCSCYGYKYPYPCQECLAPNCTLYINCASSC